MTAHRIPAPLRGLVVGAGLIVVWQAVVWVTGVPKYILPGPSQVFRAIGGNMALLAEHAAITGAEILLGLLCGALLGIASALAMDYARPLRRWLLPVLVASQAIPVFALAPLLVLWLGYGMVSKVAMATLIIYFPVTASFLDGLRRTDPGWQDLAFIMGASRRSIMLRIRAPGALPALASGLRVGAAVAPIGAVIGEWVGSAGGLGHLMLNANARMQTDLMFAALATLTVLGIALYFTLNSLLARALPWVADSGADETL